MSQVVRAASRRVATGRRRWATTVGAVVVPAVVATLAVLYPGAPVAQMDLNDGAVWLTNGAALKTGRYNAAIDELNAALTSASADTDVLQDAGDVLMTRSNGFSLVDPAAVAVAGEVALPAGGEVSMAAGTIAVGDPAGQVWVGTTADLARVMSSGRPADLDLGDGGRAVVARSGVVLATRADGALSRVTVSGDGVTTTGDGSLGGTPRGIDQITAVGDLLVALAAGTLHLPGASVDLTGYGDVLALQQAGPRSDVVLVATRSSLLEVPVSGGRVTELGSGGSGAPAAPVRVGACAHAAWATATGSYLQRCDGDGPRLLDLTGMTAADRLVFRVNRDVVVLNDTVRGRVWAPTQDPELREPNWQDVEPDDQQDADDQDSPSQDTIQDFQAECNDQAPPPVAAPDDFGVRAGRTTILPVIDNDSSSDCGVLVISDVEELPAEFGELEVVYGGRALQLTTAPGATGSVELSYTINDGRGSNAPATADVRLTVRDASLDDPPVQLRIGTATVEQGAEVTYDTLTDFRDPDGDLLLLASASADGGGQVRSRQDGQVVFRASGETLGRQTVRLVVSDGTTSVEGTLYVDVRPLGSVPPVIYPLHAVTFVDQPVVLDPLASVRTSSRELVRLAGVEEQPGIAVETDLTDGTFTFTGATPGTYYVTFLVTAGSQQAAGVARVDVRVRPEVAPDPIAVLDVALLPAGGEVTIAPLRNDANPGGNVLVLQSVDADPSTGLRLAPLERELIRITSTRVLDAPVTVTYTISNGSKSVVGEILVVPVPAPAEQQVPVVADVTATVRTGGTVTIPVLDGASDPDGDRISLVPTLVEDLGPGQGLLFVSGDVLRYQAPATPTEVRATFSVTDSAANVTSATVTVVVHAADETKSPPRPRALTARVFGGDVVRIRVPLTGIDPDGDGVLLLGQDQAPLKGRIVGVGADWLDYEALPGELGTDTFTYAVEDWVGQRAVATIRVGIVPRPSTSTEVVARNDDLAVRPGRTIEARVLANDVDTGGGDLTLDPELILEEGVDASVEGRRVVLRTTETPGVVQIGYTARNERGGQDSAVLTVTVSPDAPFIAPVARDVVVPARDTINRTTVEVDVLGVAANPSGPLSDLEVSVDRSALDVATVTPAGTVLVTLGSTPRTLPYVLTNTAPDADGIRSIAFITVPALGDFPPVLRPGAPALRVIAGEELVIPLGTQVQVAPGRTAQVVQSSSVTATRADGSDLVRDGQTLVFRAPRGYAGPASISFEVSDGPLGDVTARTRVLTLPIDVLAVEDVAPVFVPSVLDVAPAESTQVDLARFVTGQVGTVEQDVARYTYALTSQPGAGFTVGLVGSVLTVSAATDVRRGTVGGASLEIGYGVSGVLRAEVDFRVVASSRPLTRLVDRQVPGVEGVPQPVQVLNDAFNPFPGEPLAVLSATVETPGAGTAQAAGGTVTVRPAEGFIGQMVTRYRVADATGDPDRVVEGRVTVTVRGRPSTPTAPRVVEVGDRSVVLAWDAPANNGEPITDYRVTVQPGGDVRSCATTTCTIDGLVNDTTYTFAVAAQNAVDWSDASPSSAQARPDVAPLAPTTPSVTRGDSEISVSWSAPENPGSPIREYQVEISPSAAGGAVFSTTGTSLVVRGLANGTGYQVRVRAVNSAPDPGAWSSSSTPVTPARIPDAPGSVQASTGAVVGQTAITVTWDAPGSDGGDPITGYQVSVDGVWTDVAGGGAARSFVFAAVPGRTYAVAVRALNTVGTGPATAQTGQVWTPPGKVRGLEASDVAAPGTAWAAGALAVTWSAPATSGGEGIAVDRYRVEIVGGALVETTDTGITLGGLVGGVAAQVQVTARNSQGTWGEPVTVTATPTTVPDTVAFDDPDTTAAPTVTFTWAAPPDGGSAITRYQVRVRGDRGSRVDTQQTSRSILVVAAPGETLTIAVWARNARGLGAEQVLSGVVVPVDPGPEVPDPGAPGG